MQICYIYVICFEMKFVACEPKIVVFKLENE